MRRDILQIRALAILYFIFAFGVAYISFLPLSWLGTGISFLFVGLQSKESLLSLPIWNLILVLLIFFATLVLPIVIFILGYLLAANIVRLGYYLLKKQRYSFCMKMLQISIILIPIGTALGILTHTVLSREAVKELFGNTNSIANP
jgi:hypothetical protein